MDIEDFDLVGGVPPRQVHPLTRVSGHDVSVAGGPGAFCRCGDSRPDSGAVSRSDWRETHLRDAWPEVERGAGETLPGFLARLSQLYVEASKIEQSLDEGVGAVGPGEGYPVAQEEFLAAGDLVEVLQHQMNQVRERLMASTWAEEP